LREGLRRFLAENRVQILQEAAGNTSERELVAASSRYHDFYSSSEPFRAVFRIPIRLFGLIWIPYPDISKYRIIIVKKNTGMSHAIFSGI